MKNPVTLIHFLLNRHRLQEIADETSAAVGSDFSVIEDSAYPFPSDHHTAAQRFIWQYKLYTFLYDFKKRQLKNKTDGR